MKHSKQRTAILDDLRARYDHPTAEMVHLSLKETMPNLSLGTVYRNLALLCELGEIRKVGDSGNGKERYDGHTHQHAHFFCVRCGAVEDFEDDTDVSALEQKLGAKIQEVNNIIRGICSKCLNEN